MGVSAHDRHDMVEVEDGTVAFGRYRFHPRRGLFRGRAEVRLAPKTLSLLGVLLDRAGVVVTKEEILASVWAGTVVSDAALATCVQDLRRALHDDARRPRYVETLHRRGYRFLAPTARLRANPARHRTPAWDPDGPRSDATRPIGRAAEIAVLREALARATAGRRQIILVVGEAGIGKTVLVDGFVSACTRRPVLVMRGQCVERFGAGEAYLPLLDALSRLTRGRYRALAVPLLERHAPTWLGQLPLAPATAGARRPPPAVTPERMLLELSEALEAIAAELCVVLWLEDLHWADPSTLDWLACLARRPEAARLMVVATVRTPELMSEAAALPAVVGELRAHRLCRELVVQGLTRAAAQEYVTRRFALRSPTEDLHRLADALHRRTDGNPLFMVNVVEDLVIREIVTRVDGRWRLRLPAGPLLMDVPRDVRALIERQIDRLAPLEQDVLRTAGLVGTGFTPAAVAAGMDVPAGDVAACCAELARRGRFIGSTGTERWPDGTVNERYGFLHELYRDELSARCPLDERRRRHARIGALLETAYGPRASEIAAELAMHLGAAHDVERTLRYLQHAGHNAVARNAPREALEHLTRALDLSGGPDEMARGGSHLATDAVDIRLALRPVLSLLGQGRRALELLREADVMAGRLGDDVRRARVWAFTTTMHTVLGEMDEAVACGTRARAVAETHGDLELRLVASGALEQAYYFRGEYGRVVELATANLGALPAGWAYSCFGGVSPIGIYDRYFLIQSLAELGRFDDAGAETAEAIRLAAGTDHATGIGSAYYAATTLHVLDGAWAAAADSIERAVAAFRAGDVVLHVPWALACSAWVAARVGDASLARARLAEAEPLLEAHAANGIVLAQSWAFHALGRAALLMERPDHARRLAHRALAAAVSHPGYRAHALRLLGDVAAHPERFDPVRAERCYLEARSEAEARGMRPLVAECLRGLGAVYRRTNRRRAAARCLCLARDMVDA